MNRSDAQLATFAGAAGIVALILGIALQPQQPNLAGDRGYQEQTSSYRAGGAGCEPEKIKALPIQMRERKAYACEDTQDQHREAANNFMEIRRSAIAAEASAVATSNQARIEAWGAAIGFLTLMAAAAAALFAKKAADHTDRSAKAAEDLLAHEKSNSVAVNRPWLLPERVSNGLVQATPELPDDAGMYFQITLRNFGSRPATKTFVFCDLKATNANESCPAFAEPPMEDQHGFAGPGGFTLTSPLTITNNVVESWKKSEILFWLRCFTQYAEPTVGGRPYVTDAIYRITFVGMGKTDEGELIARFQGKMESAILK
jgi:hypothetical protein